MTCTAQIRDCGFWYAPDAPCQWAAYPHSTMCDRHMAYETSVWHVEHDTTDCCPECCEGATHTTDGAHTGSTSA